MRGTNGTAPAWRENRNRPEIQAILHIRGGYAEGAICHRLVRRCD